MQLVVVVVSFCLAAVASAGEDNSVKNLGYTSYQGVNQDNGVSFWKGMRFAAAPVGQLRFAPPQDPIIELGVQSATTHGPMCIATSTYPIPGNQSEDCLFVDVYAPTNATEELLPVYFFIQGGGFNANSNADYDGSGLVMASGFNILVVTFNYRVGPYGFLASKEVEWAGSLNNGLKDIIKALEWTNEHIAIFGGDPNHVTIGGDSAGAGAITLLLTAYGGSGILNTLFHASAAESQSFGSQATVAESQFAYDNLTTRTGCAGTVDTFSCLRNLELNTLQQENYGIPFPGNTLAPLYPYSPTIDHDLVPDYTERLFGQGKFMKVPVIFGDDTNEGTIFPPKNTSSVDQADQFIQANFPTITTAQLNQINSIYLTSPDDPVYPTAGDYWQGVSNAYGEMRYICPGIYLSTAFNAHPSTAWSNWNYHYAVTDYNAETSGYGTQHTIETNAIWGPQYVSSTPPASYFTNNSAIVPVMQGYWTSFIRSYNPNTHRAPGTPQWDSWGDNYNRIFIRTNQTKMETVPDDQRTRCTYLQSIALELNQ
ncbi:putative triacylglycerol lipase [Talaromyces proteolyticus]|uniref:Carboxylic ester hydrolase n=1 Tax=Talaromyces proteolyticus TaxID=1131652 RepID=A0AAD4Q374_9EURO|nr:putative triacylglycerol lipase [Talaromyces proteolyticus]KAH8701136.1 putative triacylglycerol lipase [Talaromyces proteolyticus]